MAKGICSVEDCERDIKARRLCGMHYQRLKKTGTTSERQVEPKYCSVEGCNGPHVARGWCSGHYKRWNSGYALDERPIGVWLKSECSVDGCLRDVQANGLCHAHYYRAYRGRALGGPIPEPMSVDQRFWSKVDKTESCWVWTASIYQDNGYGQFSDAEGRKCVAHRWSYEDQVGAVPDGLWLDHICWNRRCVNPTHLRVVTTKQNSENQQGPSSRSTTGVRGVFIDKRGRIRAGVTHNYEHLSLGYFASIEEAEAAVIAKRNELFTHNNADRRDPAA